MQTIKNFSKYLNNFEQSEILSYPKIYYINLGEKATNAWLKQGDSNSGYDDDKNYYRYLIGDHICYRFEIVSRLGKGSFGQVVKTFDHQKQEFTAVKIIRNKSRFHK